MKSPTIHFQDACFDQAINFKVNQHSSAIELLLRIKNPEHDKRAWKITAGVRMLLDDEVKFSYGVAWISIFKLTYLKNEQFENVSIISGSIIDQPMIGIYHLHILCSFQIIYKAHIVNSLNSFDIFLTEEEDKLRYLKTLDDALARALDNRISSNYFEPNFIYTVGKWKLASLIGKQAKKYNINIEKFRAQRVRVISEIRYKFFHDSPVDFERYAAVWFLMFGF